MKKAPEQYRVTDHPMLGSDASYGNNGCFCVPHPKIANYYFNVQISDGMGWEHVSITVVSDVRKVERCPTWMEMCFIKDLFFAAEAVAVQYHPAEKDYVSNHPYCLHIWKPVGVELPVPLPEMVGNVKVNVKVNVQK